MLYYFLLGIIFIQWCIPIGESFTEVILSFFELLKGKLGLRLAKYNLQIQKITDEINKPTETNAIGFKVYPVEEEDEEYEEE